MRDYPGLFVDKFATSQGYFPKSKVGTIRRMMSIVYIRTRVSEHSDLYIYSDFDDISSCLGMI